MSQAAAAAASGSGMTGSCDDNPEEKKGKGMFGKNIPEDSPILPLTSSSDEESDDQGGDDQPAAKIRGGKRSTLDCLALLEASLPMKRGISSNYCGKSKSYGILSEVGVVDAKELGKEHAVNKHRRLLIAREYLDASSLMTIRQLLPRRFSLFLRMQMKTKMAATVIILRKKHEEDGK